MEARTATAAAIPLVIALAGGATFPTGSDDANRRFRVAPAALSQPLEASLNDVQQSWLEEHNPFGRPKETIPGNWTIIVRQGYTLAHNNLDLIADWVTFRLTREYVEGTEKRPGSSAFKPDPLLPKGRRAELSDYKGLTNVYDRGHQAANADSKGRGRRVIRDSFFLSNMTPQDSQLNRIRWRLLEERIQNLAKDRGEIWVMTGPVFMDDDNDGIIEYFVVGENQVAVPTHYYKIVVTERQGADAEGHESMAFLIPNVKMEGVYEDYLVSIDEIETLTGFDFLEGMEDEAETALEVDAAAELLPLKEK